MTNRAPQGTVGLIVPPNLSLKEIVNMTDDKVKENNKKRWWNLYLIYFVFGGISLLVGLKQTIFSGIRQKGCFAFPNISLNNIYNGLSLVAAGGGRMILPSLLLMVIRRQYKCNYRWTQANRVANRR